MANIATIYNGSKAIFSVRILNTDGSVFDFTGTTEITAIFPGVTPVTITLTDSEIVESGCGELELTISELKTPNITSGDTQSFEILIDKGSTNRTVVQFLEALTVVARLFPTIT